MLTSLDEIDALIVKRQEESEMSIVNHSLKRSPPEIAKVSPKKQAVTKESVDPHPPTPIDTKKDTVSLLLLSIMSRVQWYRHKRKQTTPIPGLRIIKLL